MQIVARLLQVISPYRRTMMLICKPHLAGSQKPAEWRVMFPRNVAAKLKFSPIPPVYPSPPPQGFIIHFFAYKECI
jgi:hypothetical protein